jgi:ABC-type dipeptide/oligopeptide/nickel transport system ATPase component
MLLSIQDLKVGFLFQDPMSSLNPVLTVGDQLTEAILLHQGF